MADSTWWMCRRRGTRTGLPTPELPQLATDFLEKEWHPSLGWIVGARGSSVGRWVMHHAKPGCPARAAGAARQVFRARAGPNATDDPRAPDDPSKEDATLFQEVRASCGSSGVGIRCVGPTPSAHPPGRIGHPRNARAIPSSRFPRPAQIRRAGRRRLIQCSRPAATGHPANRMTANVCPAQP